MKHIQKENLCIEIGEGRTKVNAQILFQGEHIIILLGGSQDHIGSVALAESGKELSDDMTVQMITRDGHREDEVALKMARKIADAFGVPVLVSAGIHVDNITSDEIALIISNCELLTNEILKTILSDEK